MGSNRKIALKFLQEASELVERAINLSEISSLRNENWDDEFIYCADSDLGNAISILKSEIEEEENRNRC